MARKNETRAVTVAPQAPALVETQGTGITGAFAGLQLGGGLEIVGMDAVTRPVLKQQDGVPFAVRIIGAIHKGETIKREKKDGAPEMEPANLCFVMNLQTGEEQTLIANAAMQSALERAYGAINAATGEPAYVGMDFGMISQLRPHDGGRKQLREYLIKRLHLGTKGRHETGETIDTRAAE